jgi:pimeloyl-ACP methyl ester carboxylesterase
MRRGVALLVVLALVLVGVGVAAFSLTRGGAGSYDPVPVTAPPGTAPARQPPDPALARFYAQRLDWSACGDDRCATMSVPLDYAHPDGETIGIHVLLRPADDQGDKVGALVVNPGGPGEPGSAEAANAGSYFRRPLLTSFDIVGFDPRGTGASDPVDCLGDQQLDAYIAADPEPDTPAQVTQFVHEARALGRGCRRLSGALASHISTVEAARDMDVLRAVLGEQTMSYLGSSYGTELGATYADLFPARVGRFLLDGAVDPTQGYRAQALAQAAGFETALRSYVANCLDVTDSCFLGDSVDQGVQRIRTLLDQIAAKPLPTSSGRPLTASLAFYGIAFPLYSRDLWILLSQALQGALGGDGSALMRLSDIYSARSSDGTYQNNSMEAFAAISCLDDPEGIRAADVPAQYAAFERASPTFGKVFAWGLVACRGWAPARGVTQPQLTYRAKGAAPIVVVGTTRDPATPLAWARSLAALLDSGVLVTRDGDGHTAYDTGNACIDTAVESFLIEDQVPRDGLAC